MDTNSTNITQPDNASISPYDEDEIEQLRPSTAKPRLRLLGGNIRREEQTLRRHLSELNRQTEGDLLDVVVEEKIILQNQPEKYEKAERIDQLQSQLKSYYNQWQTYCEQHQRETSNSTAETNKSV